ncbi:hypothetical protein M378DRAFT_678594 [Amanita muscaria Koide BX008]|uniref:Complex III subunit 7 n=1 Tax=Amanita muscaria (strain Koide BX008) TaxID=946122 RepID=A0A0C2TQL4_AMAMK|nr:hypothetical protein M378DRAFT_678594 [Amanita muscaria Koide BX008]
MVFGSLGPSLAPYLKSSRTIYGWIKPIANWYAKASGYQKYGFKYDDLLIEERDDVQRALTRLTPREKYDRAFRLKRASQASVLHTPLSQKEWTKREEDVRYLKPHVVDVSNENAERKKWDTLVLERK